MSPLNPGMGSGQPWVPTPLLLEDLPLSSQTLLLCARRHQPSDLRPGVCPTKSSTGTRTPCPERGHRTARSDFWACRATQDRGQRLRAPGSAPAGSGIRSAGEDTSQRAIGEPASRLRNATVRVTTLPRSRLGGSQPRRPLRSSIIDHCVSCPAPSQEAGPPKTPSCLSPPETPIGCVPCRRRSRPRCCGDACSSARNFCPVPPWPWRLEPWRGEGVGLNPCPALEGKTGALQHSHTGKGLEGFASRTRDSALGAPASSTVLRGRHCPAGTAGWGRDARPGPAAPQPPHHPAL